MRQLILILALLGIAVISFLISGLIVPYPDVQNIPVLEGWVSGYWMLRFAFIPLGVMAMGFPVIMLLVERDYKVKEKGR